MEERKWKNIINNEEVRNNYKRLGNELKQVTDKAKTNI
jgi:hypothetical protein